MTQQLLKCVTMAVLLFSSFFVSANDGNPVPNNIAHTSTWFSHLADFKNLNVTEKQNSFYHQDNNEYTHLLERSSQQQAVRFLHPKQQTEFILVFNLTLDTFISENRLRPDKPQLPWYMCNTRPNHGFIDACKPANLTYKARLTYHA